MSTGLVRTTTYFDENLLAYAKKMAIDEGKSLYEVLNEKLSKAFGLTVVKAKTTSTKKLSYEELFGPPFKSGLLKKHLTRADYYE